MSGDESNNRKCKKCGMEVPLDSKRCLVCGTWQNVPVFRIVLVVAIVILLFVFIFYDDENNFSNDQNNNGGNSSIYPDKPNSSEPPTNNEPTIPNDEPIITDKSYSFNEMFVFDDFEITIGSNYTFDVVKNSFSEYNNQSVVKLPITVKNIGSETNSLNSFYYEIFGSLGVELDTLGAYFDDSLDFAGSLRSGASYTKYLYFLYDGNGKYAIEFDNFSEEVEVEFEILK